MTFGDAYKRFLSTHALEDVGIDHDVFADVRNSETGRKVSL